MNQINVNISQNKNSISAGVKNVVPINPAKGTFKINKNGKFNVKDFEFADVNVVNVNIQKKSLTISKNGSYEILPDENYFLEKASVNVNVPIPEDYIVPEGTKNINANGKYDITEYKYVDVDVPIPEGYVKPEGTIEIIENGEVDVTKYAKTNVNIDTAKPEQSKSTVPTKNTQTILPDEGYVLNEVTVYPIPEEYIIPEGTLDITENGEYNVTDKASVNININASSGEDMLQTRVNATNSCDYLFYRYVGDNVDYIAKLDTSNATSMNYMFNGCTSLTSIPQLDTRNATSMTYMFSGCTSLTSIPLLNTSKVGSMNYMFNGCTSLTSIPLLNTSKVGSMNNMFNGCTSLTSIPLLNTSKVGSMSNIFKQCISLKSILMYGIRTSLDISASTQFETEDLVTILNNLATITNTKTLTMGATNLAKLSDEQKQIAINKGWTLA